MDPSANRFGELLRETLEELDRADAEEGVRNSDPVEQLRLEAAMLLSGSDVRQWPTGAALRYRSDLVSPSVHPPTFDIRYPVGSRPGADIGTDSALKAGASVSVRPRTQTGRKR